MARPVSSHPFPYTTLFRSRAAALVPSIRRIQRNGAHHDDALVLVGATRGVDLARTSEDLLRSELEGHAVRIRPSAGPRSEEHTSELQSLRHLVCRLLLEKK